MSRQFTWDQKIIANNKTTFLSSLLKNVSCVLQSVDGGGLCTNTPLGERPTLVTHNNSCTVKTSERNIAIWNVLSTTTIFTASFKFLGLTAQILFLLFDIVLVINLRKMTGSEHTRLKSLSNLVEHC